VTFTSTTLRKLRALNLGADIEDRILEIFEEARISKPKKGGAADRAVRGTRLPDDWDLPAEWRDYALRVGLRPAEVSREAAKFKNYWTAQSGAKGIKMRWDSTWRNWCISMLERAGRPIATPSADGKPAAAPDDPTKFTDETWRAIAKRVQAGAQWNPAWGPPPGRMDCLIPDGLL
jgi:hypothetical protein